MKKKEKKKKISKKKNNSNNNNSNIKGVYIKYVGGGPEGFYKFFQKFFKAQETIDLNISWPSNFFEKYFMAPPINFSSLFKACL